MPQMVCEPVMMAFKVIVLCLVNLKVALLMPTEPRKSPTNSMSEKRINIKYLLAKNEEKENGVCESSV